MKSAVITTILLAPLLLASSAAAQKPCFTVIQIQKGGQAADPAPLICEQGSSVVFLLVNADPTGAWTIQIADDDFVEKGSGTKNAPLVPDATKRRTKVGALGIEVVKAQVATSAKQFFYKYTIRVLNPTNNLEHSNIDPDLDVSPPPVRLDIRKKKD